jgi:hypothetical protein
MWRLLCCDWAVAAICRCQISMSLAVIASNGRVPQTATRCQYVA